MATKFSADYAKRVSACKKCKLQLPKGELRIAKHTPNPFVQNAEGPPPDMKQYYHARCLFEMFMKARATTKVIEGPGDIEGWQDVTDEDKEKVVELIDETMQAREKGASTSASRKSVQKTLNFGQKPLKEPDDDGAAENAEASPSKKGKKNAKEEEKEEEDDGDKPDETSRFNSFDKFCKLCDVIATFNKHTDKAAKIRQFFDKSGYDGDTHTIMRFLIPSSDQRVYNLKEKQLLKHFSAIYNEPLDRLTASYNKSGDLSETISEVAAKSDKFPEITNSGWSIQKVDRYLKKLAEKTKDEDQIEHLRFIAKRLSPAEIKYLLRLVKKDMRFNAGTKVIMDGLHPKAYEAYQSCRDMREIVRRVETGLLSSKTLDVDISLGTPILPMLAEACKSVEFAMKRCPNGMLAEIKYDGERVQVHKKGKEFSFYSRSLKPVQDHKVAPFQKIIAKAFPDVENLILDAEVLMVDTETSKPLPFGTLGIHKRENFKNAAPCLFVFDCLLHNDTAVRNLPLQQRKKFLEDNLKEIPNSIMHSNYQVIKNGENHKLKTMILDAIDEGLEGLVMKDLNGVYEPGKRHWLKVKKDYLEEGGMADTADLIVLGAYYGTGNKGGLMSVFLMGVYCEKTKSYRTVTKCGNGHTDEILERINKELKPKMKQINQKASKLPSWIRCASGLCPDFVIEDPEQAPVWEITGAEFSKSDKHTADGISIRFPRVTRIRDDKDVSTSTSLKELKRLFEASKEKCDIERDATDKVPLYAKDRMSLGKAMHEPEDVKPETSKAEEDVKPSKKRSALSEVNTSPKAKKVKPEVKEEEADDVEMTPDGDDEQKEQIKEKKAKTKEASSQKAGEKQKCPYGSLCYRTKNKEHMAEYEHITKK